MSFNPGDRVKWIYNGEEYFGTVTDYDKDLDFQKKRRIGKDYICVRFDDVGPYYDGVAIINKDDQNLIHAGTIVPKFTGPAPKNNDGRAECFWCSGSKNSKKRWW